MTKHQINPALFEIAEWRLQGEEKRAFVPQGATDPAAAAGGMPPGMDPAAMGGMPPGMDPAAMGGMPPGMDPAAMGAMPPAPPSAPMAPMAQPAAQPGAPGAGGKSNKIDPAFIYMELSRLRKLVTHMMQHVGVDMPPDILEDNTVAMVAQGQQPQSQPIGQGGQAEQGGASLPGIGGSGAINPIQPAGGGGGTEKPASDILAMFRTPPGAPVNYDNMANRIDALARLSRNMQQEQ